MWIIFSFCHFCLKFTKRRFDQIPAALRRILDSVCLYLRHPSTSTQCTTKSEYFLDSNWEAKPFLDSRNDQGLGCHPLVQFILLFSIEVCLLNFLIVRLRSLKMKSCWIKQLSFCFSFPRVFFLWLQFLFLMIDGIIFFLSLISCVFTIKRLFD